jgi:hypothetical protein
VLVYGALYDTIRKIAATRARLTAICKMIRRVMLNSVGSPVPVLKLRSHCPYMPNTLRACAALRARGAASADRRRESDTA